MLQIENIWLVYLKLIELNLVSLSKKELITEL